MSLTSWEYFAVLLVTTVIFLFVRNKIGRSKLPYPPGPKGSFLIGNIRDIPSSHEWITYAQWSRDFSKCCSRNHLHQKFTFNLSQTRMSYTLAFWVPTSLSLILPKQLSSCSKSDLPSTRIECVPRLHLNHVQLINKFEAPPTHARRPVS